MSSIPPLPPPSAPRWTVGGIGWKVLIFVLGTVAGWLTEDTLKRRTVEFVDSKFEQYVPWDASWFQRFFPNELRFESTQISGCSGGELERLVQQAKTQGMNIREEENAKATRLCQNWTHHGAAKSILETMASKYDNCFSFDQNRSFEVRLNSPFICKTDYALNPQTNGWIKIAGATTLLCLGQPVKTRMSTAEPFVHLCPEDVLQRLGFSR
jgi:hypothetical protein